MSARLRFYAQETLIAIGAWTVFTFLYWWVAFYGPGEVATLSPGMSAYLESGGVQLEILLEGLLLGLFYSVIHYLTERPLVRKRPFGQVVVFKAVLQLFALVLVGGVVYFLYSRMGAMPQMTEREWEGMGSGRFVMSLLAWLGFCAFLVSFLLEMRRKLGPGVLLPLMTGKYFQPREEERLFLFLDLKDSTSHTERLGHRRYSQLIRSCYDDLCDLVMDSDAEIYQYVGDGVVLSWLAKEGVEDQCLHLFEKFHLKLQARGDEYRSRFEVVPGFRGGADRGTATVTEVGYVKRELAYHGDVLNTAARLEASCKALGAELLVSESVFLNLVNQSRFAAQGELELRGKQKRVQAYSLGRSPKASSD